MTPISVSSLSASSPASCLLIVVIFITSLCSLLNHGILLRLFFHPSSIVSSHEYYRLFTGDFVHNDLIHLMINEATMMTFCISLEGYLHTKTAHGSLDFLIIYWSSCLAGTIPATIRHFKDFNYSSTGASGSITGCIFSYILLVPNQTAYFLPLIGAVSNTYGGLIFLAGLILYKWRSKNKLINHEVHFYGALGGIFVTLLLFPGLL